MKKTNKPQKRTLGRQLAKELSKDELASIPGALGPIITYAAGVPGDVA